MSIQQKANPAGVDRESQLPEEAKITEDLDCMLFNTKPPSYRGGIVAIAASEMSLKTKTFEIDIHGSQDNYKPWYIKLNPGMYIPTMTVQGNVPVCESVNIAEYMDKNLTEAKSLMFNQPDWVKERYEQFKEKHEGEWDVEGYTFGHLQTIWYVRQVVMFSFIKGGNNTVQMLKKNKYPELKETLINKLYTVDSVYLDIHRNRHERLAKAKGEAAALLELLSGWLGEDKEFALGTDNYSMADVICTTFLVRLYVCKAFWNKEIVEKRPNVLKYWERMQKRPSIKAVTIMPVTNLNTFTMSLILLLISCILGVIIFGITYAFTECDWWVFPAIAGGIFAFIVLFFAIQGCRMRSQVSDYNAKLGKLDRNDPDFVDKLW